MIAGVDLVSSIQLESHSMMMRIAVLNLPKLRQDEYVEQNQDAKQLAEKFRDLRLHALLVAPEDFASTYEVEVARGLGQTLDRLRNGQADHFFAVELQTDWPPEEHQDVIHELLKAKWVGMILLIGPLESTSSVSAAIDPLAGQTGRTTEAQVLCPPEHRTLRYQLNGTFVDPGTRRHGVGKALVEAALGKARAECLNQYAALDCSVLVDAKNSAAQKLYQKVGFVTVGEESYTQLPRFIAGEWEASERTAFRMEIR